MNDWAKTFVVAAVLVTAVYFATRVGKRMPASPWSKVQPGDAEPAGVGANFNPAFISTAASSEPLITGEPETGNIVQKAICPPARTAKSCSGGCH